ncbi:MAG: indolepyruvate oxidoreductase subunit beta [Anaerolineae bacterium]|nr:indolepyruvate oxidoreductase subunit beta [Anaerolineae bacterium]
MKYDMILCGVGGQGVLSIAAVIGVAAVDNGLHLKQAEVHGLSQRGGAVESHLRLSDQPIYSDLIPAGSADMLLSMEPMETLRYVPFLSGEGTIVADNNPFVNIPNYPDLGTIITTLERYPRVVLVDAEGIATEMRAKRSSNMVLLGAASVFMPLSPESLEAAIGTIFGRKGEAVIEQNVAALRQGRAVAQAQTG